MSADLYRETIEAAGVKRVGRALHLSDSMVYKLARPASDPDHPDRTGTDRNDLDRLTTLLEVVSSLPSARPVLHRWRQHFEQLFDRLLNHREIRPVTQADVIAYAARCAEEHGQALKEALTEGDDEKAMSECCEAAEALRQLMEALAQKIDHDKTIPMRIGA